MRRDDDLGPEEPPRDAEGRQPPTPPRAGISLRQVIIAILAVLLIAFAIANFERVNVSFLLFDAEARVVTVIAVAGGLGFVIGYFVGRPSRQQRKRLAKLDDD
jgi:uncharacterized integral membrane protein